MHGIFGFQATVITAPGPGIEVAAGQKDAIAMFE